MILNWGHYVSLTMLTYVLTMTVYTELQTDRIPDWITIPGLLVGFVVGYMDGGISLGNSIAGFLLGFGFLFIFYMFGGMGGGDVKLMGAIGALLGWEATKGILFNTAFIGGAMALLVLVWNKQLWRGLGRSFGMLLKSRGKALDDAEEQPEEEERKPLTVPYGLAIVLGAILHLVTITLVPTY